MRTNSSMLRRAIVVVLAAIMISPTTTFAAVTTDQEDYSPGSVVTISGESDSDVTYYDGNRVDVAVTGPVSSFYPAGWTADCWAIVDSDGTWSCTIVLDSDPDIAVGDYSYVATQRNADDITISTENGTFTDGVAATFSAPKASGSGLTWYRGNFNLAASGKVTCTSTGAACSDSSVSVSIHPSDNAADNVGSLLNLTTNVSKTIATGTGNNKDWSTTFVFKTSPSIGEWTLPPDGKYDAQAFFDFTGQPDQTIINDDAFGVDNTKPTLAVGGYTYNASATAPNSPLSISGSVGDATSGLPGGEKVKVELRSGSTEGSVILSSSTGNLSSGTGSQNWTVNFTTSDLASLTPGESYCIVATGINDVAGNSADAASPSSPCFTVVSPDTTAPLITVTKVEGTTSVTGTFTSATSGNQGSVYSNKEVTITWSANESGTYRVTLSGCAAPSAVTASGTNTSGTYETGVSGTAGVVVSTIDATNFSDGGTKNVGVCLEDSSGNSSGVLFSVTFDTSAPTVAITRPVDEDDLLPSEYLALCAATTAEICGTASDATAGLKTANGVEARIIWNDGTEDLYFDGTDFDPGTEVWNDVTSSLNAGAWSLGFNPHTATGGTGNGAIWQGFVSETFVATARAEDNAGNKAEETDEVEFTVAKADVNVLYTGSNFVTQDSPTPLALSATVTSLNGPCKSGVTVNFTVAGSNGDETLVTDVTDGDGLATAFGPDEPDIYEVEVSVDESLDCRPTAPSSSVVSVVAPGAAANGGGWYQHHYGEGGSPRINFGFTVRKDCGSTANPCSNYTAENMPYKGQFIAINNGRWRLKGTVNYYGTTNCPTMSGWSGTCGSVRGSGNLFSWDDSLNGGLGDWVHEDMVTFTVAAYDGGSSKKSGDKPDYSGIITITGYGGSDALPLSSPLVLKGGGVTLSPVVLETSTTTSGSTTTTTTKKRR